MTKKHGQEQPRSGMVAIVGRPNVGKSTLLNQIVGEKVAIVTNVPQTTRNQVRGIYTEERGQIVFVDTPGWHKGRDRLDQFMNRSASAVAQDVDSVIHLVDVSEPTGREETQVVERLAALDVPVILGLNKIDITDRFIPQYVELWEQVKDQPAQDIRNWLLLPLSGLTGKNIDKLLDVLFEQLPVGPPLYPEDTLTDTPLRMAMADVIREKLFLIARQELPHALAVIIEEVERRRRKVVHIRALILVERDSQKSIVVGKGGGILKEVGTLARQDLEDLLQCKVFLDLYVKSRKGWRDSSSLLLEMGYESI